MVAKPALSEKRANIAAPNGPTMNAIACAALPMPKAVPRRSRLTFSAIMVLVAGIIDAFRNAARVKASTNSQTELLSASSRCASAVSTQVTARMLRRRCLRKNRVDRIHMPRALAMPPRVKARPVASVTLAPAMSFNAIGVATDLKAPRANSEK